MARHETFEDLLADDPKVATRTVADIDMWEIMKSGTAAQISALSGLIAAFDTENTLVLDRDPDKCDRKWVIYREASDEEKEDHLRAEQRHWDAAAGLYMKALGDPATVHVWERWSVDRWAKREGVAAINWDAPE